MVKFVRNFLLISLMMSGIGFLSWFRGKTSFFCKTSRGAWIWTAGVCVEPLGVFAPDVGVAEPLVGVPLLVPLAGFPPHIPARTGVCAGFGAPPKPGKAVVECGSKTGALSFTEGASALRFPAALADIVAGH